MIRTLTSIICAALVVPAIGQISFRPAAEGHTEGFFSGVAVMVTDVNGDGRDDIVRMRGGNRVTVTLQGQDDRFVTTFEYQINGGEQWNITGGDLDNDGGFDILTSGVYDRVKVLRSVPSSNDFTVGTVGANNFFGQAANVVDINNDGYLDHFVCHDDAESVIFMNDSTGNLVHVDTIIDFTTDPPSDNSGNYGSVWTDIDSDGDIDLYIAKCRGGVNNPADPRRINALYLNNGDGTWSEKADSFNLAIGAQSWTADFGDIDNDGDFDCFITNHNVPGQLLENVDNAYFRDITDSAGVAVSGLSIQGSFRDFDNDGLLDLIVVGTSNYIYRNLGDNQFEAVQRPFSDRMITSYGIGDLNSDGYLDLYSTYNELYNDPSNVLEDVIWLNNGGDNHHVNVHLIGMQCNRDGIGSRVVLYGESGMQTREVRGGEGYGITCSFNQHFGIGKSESVDSIAVTWPNGVREVHTDIDINRTVVIREGGCVTYLLDLAQGPYTQCDTAEYAISAPDGYASYLWNNGDTSQIVTAVEPGVYHVTLTDTSGCEWIAGPVIISPVSDIEPEEIRLTADGSTKACAGDTLFLAGPDGAISYLWSTGDTTTSIIAMEAGEYSLQATYACKTLTSDTVSLSVLDPNTLVVENDTIYGEEYAVLSTAGDSIVWYDELGVQVATGVTFMTELLDTTTTYYVQQVSTIPGEHLTVGPTEHSGGTLYNSGTANGAIRFDVLNRFRLDSVLVFTTFVGDRTVIIEDAGGDTIYSQTFFIDTGTTFLPIDFWLEPGSDYIMTTDRATNQLTFGVNSPRLVRSDGGFLYPFVSPEVVEITGTASSQQFYYYFYDWRFTTEAVYCDGELLPVQVVFIDTTSAVRDIRITELELMPNPASSSVTISRSTQLQGDYIIEVLDIHGKHVSGWTADRATDQILVSDLPQGMYVVRIAIGDVMYVGRFVKM